MAERMQFSYEALDRSGNKVTGSLEAGSDGEATRRLAQQGLTPYALKRARGAAWAGPRRKHASARELQLVLHEFSTLLEAGVGLVTALSSLAKSSHHPSLTGAFTDMVASAILQVTGRKPTLSTTGGTSDARFIKNYCSVVEFGLVGQTMHAIDEQVPVAELVALTEIYRRILDLYFAQ